MSSTILFTGFPGFLGVRLLPRVLARSDARAVCLVQPHFTALAEQRVAELEAAEPALAGRVELVTGDITLADLGLGHERYHDLANSTVEVFHLAAVYDLAVEAGLAHRVNVEGTHHVTDFARHCDDLRRYQYVSTCYVSGRYPGAFRESDLVLPQQVFNNHYEHTKHLAEVVVRDAMREHGLPTTIYRPSVVAGDAATGETQKYDGPYYVAKLLLGQPRVAVVPLPGDPTSYRFNMVPRDFVIDAIATLSAREDNAGTCYALADPAPGTIAELIEVFGEATGRRIVTVPVTRGLAKGILGRVPGIGKVFPLPAPAVDYFTHPTYYLTDNASRDLAGTGIAPPSFRDYVPRLVEYVRAHPDVSSAAMT